MSPKRDKTVPQLVEKYREKYPDLDRDLVRKLIRLENKIENLSELKKLDRYLRKAFKNKNKNFQSSAATEEAVVQTVRQLRKIALRNPLPLEIADETGMSPEQSEEVARKTRDKTGWSMPNTAILEDAAERLGEVLCYLARERDHVLKDFDYKQYLNDPEIVNIAKLGLKEHLEMLPKLTPSDSWDWNVGEVASWPSKALKYLRNNYKPKKRNYMGKMLKFRLRKGKGSVNRFTAADGTKYKPGDVVELPIGYRGAKWLEVVKPAPVQMPMQEVKQEEQKVILEKQDVVPLAKKEKKGQKRVKS